MAEQFNRYNRAPQIRIDGKVARDKPLAGIFDADDPESPLMFLAKLNDLAVERRGDNVTVKAR